MAPRTGRYGLLIVVLVLTVACLPGQLGGASPTAAPAQPPLPSPTAPPPEASSSTSSGQPPIFVSIVMHNEEPNANYPDFLQDEAAFWRQREGLVRFVDMLHANGVAFNYQSDWNFLMAVARYDAGTPETDGKNVVRYIYDLGFEVDPHAHETEYNYADVAYLIQSLDVPPSHTVGGFIAAPPEESKLEYFWEPIVSTLNPTYVWQAEILWGASTYLHQDDTPIQASGVWKPRDREHFLEHDDSAPLPHIGGYGRDCERLVRLQQQGKLREGRIHTCTLFVSQSFAARPGFVEEFERRIRNLDAAGEIRWVGLAEVIRIWETEYGAEPSILPYAGADQ